MKHGYTMKKLNQPIGCNGAAHLLQRVLSWVICEGKIMQQSATEVVATQVRARQEPAAVQAHSAP